MFLVLALFGDGADVEIAVAPVFVVFVATTRWMKDKELYLTYPNATHDCSYSATWDP